MYFRTRKFTLVAMVLALLSIGALHARSISATRQRSSAVSVPAGGTRQVVVKGEFRGAVELLFCIKNGDGKWDPIDKLTIPSVRFAATLDAITKGKAVAGGLEFQGKTTGGRDVSVRMLRPGKSEPNLKDGKVGLTLPLRIIVNSKSADVELNLTTETIQAINGGTVSGHRLEVDQATGTVKFVLVGSQIANGFIAIFAPVGDQASNAMFFPGQLRVAMQLSGKLISLNQ